MRNSSKYFRLLFKDRLENHVCCITIAIIIQALQTVAWIYLYLNLLPTHIYRQTYIVIVFNINYYIFIILVNSPFCYVSLVLSIIVMFVV